MVVHRVWHCCELNVLVWRLLCTQVVASALKEYQVRGLMLPWVGCTLAHSLHCTVGVRDG